MKAKRVDCVECENFNADVEPEGEFKYSCNLGKRIMFRKPIGYYYFNVDFLFPRYCNEFKKQHEKY